MTQGNSTAGVSRSDHLRAISESYLEEADIGRAGPPLAATEPTCRFAAVVSQGSPESRSRSNGKLIAAGSAAELAELLRLECAEGWVAHGRVWDLDAPFDLWGNLEISYRVQIGEECTRLIHMVQVEGREAGTYLFDDLLDAEAFVDAVRRQGGEPVLSQEPLRDNRAADRLIDAEREPSEAPA